MNKNDKFETVEFNYKAVMKPFNSDKEYVSKESFKTYKEAFEYAKNEAKYFEPCEFFVATFPDLDIDVNLGGFNA